MRAAIRVFIIDDHAIVRAGLRQLLAAEPDMQCTGEAEGGGEAIRKLRESDCDLVLLDIAMPGKNGIETLKQLKKEKPRLRVLMLSMYPEDQYAVRSLKAGAAGYLTKQTPPAELVAAIRHVASGKKYITAPLAEALAESFDTEFDRPAHEGLSDREFQVLRMIGSGKTLSGIADALALSVKTVSVYRARVLEKLRLANSAELTHYAIKHGLVE
jgi:two-component system, NarL family, invasion response regulator UvrY